MRSITCILLALSISAMASAQVTARHAEPSAQTPERFTSPMVLDLRLYVADPSTWGTGPLRAATGEGIGKYSCDGVSFRDFAIAADKVRGNNVKITYHAVLVNEPGIDKVATVKLQIMRGETVISSKVFRDVSVEEGKITVRDDSVIVPASDLTVIPAPTFRIIVDVRDDG